MTNSNDQKPTEEKNSPEADGWHDRWHRHHHHHGRRKLWVVAIPFFIAAFVAAKSGAVLFLWNALIPEVFHGPTLNFVQAVELVILAKLLVGFGGGHRGWGGHRRHEWKARWAGLSPEEREKLRDTLRSRWRD